MRKDLIQYTVILLRNRVLIPHSLSKRADYLSLKEEKFSLHSIFSS